MLTRRKKKEVERAKPERPSPQAGSIAHVKEACKHNNDEMFANWQEEGGVVSQADDKMWTPLLWASYYGAENIARELIKDGADVHAKTAAGDTCLHWAAFKGHEYVVRLLVENDANPVARGEYGNTPMHSAAASGVLGVVTALLEYGDEAIYLKNDFGNSPIVVAGKDDIRAILKNVYNVETCADCGRRCGLGVLMYFCKFCQKQFCKNCCHKAMFSELDFVFPVNTCRPCEAQTREEIRIEEERRQREEEERLRLEEEERLRREEEERKRREEEEAERMKREEEERLRREEEEKIRAQEEAKRAAEEEARRLEEEAKKKKKKGKGKGKKK